MVSPIGVRLVLVVVGVVGDAQPLPGPDQVGVRTDDVAGSRGRCARPGGRRPASRRAPAHVLRQAPEAVAGPDLHALPRNGVGRPGGSGGDSGRRGPRARRAARSATSRTERARPTPGRPRPLLRWPARRRGRPAVPAGPRRGSPGGRSGQAVRRRRPRRRRPHRSTPPTPPPSASAQVARRPADPRKSCSTLRLLAFASDNAQNLRVSNVCPQTVCLGSGRGMEKGMSWEESMFAVFDDLEQQAQGLHLVERDAEVADLTARRVLPGQPRLTLHASLGDELRVRLLGGRRRGRSAGPARGGLVPARRRNLRVGRASPGRGQHQRALRRGRTARTPGRWSTG